MEKESGGRIAIAVAGSSLAIHGLLRRDWAGWFPAAVGGAVALFALDPERTRSRGAAKPRMIKRTITVAKTPGDAYVTWRNLDVLPQLISRRGTVESAGENRHIWSMRGRLGVPVRWETEIVRDEPGRILEWQSVEHSPIRCSGAMRFKKKKGDRGTKIHLQMAYLPAKGFSAEAFNRAVASLG